MRREDHGVDASARSDDAVSENRALLDRAHHARVQDLAALGSWEWAISSGVVRWSRELYRIFGVAPSEFDQDLNAYLDRVHAEDRARVQRCIEAAIEHARPYRFEHRIVRPDGSERWLYCRGEPVLQDGDVVRLYGLALDVTERHEREERWQTFIEDAVHELRAPVATLVQAADLLAERFDELGRESREATLGTIRRQGGRLRALAADLLDLSAIERDARTHSEECVDLADAVHNAVEVAAPPPGIEVNTDAVESVTVQAGAQALERILVNLLANAYTYGGDAVAVCASGNGHEATLEVCDDGPGVPDEMRDELFTAFRASRKEGGTGLGLSIVRRLAERAQGEVAYRKSDHGGACFVVRLPQVAT